MYCTKCGSEIRETDFYCSRCGTATSKVSPQVYVPAPPKKLMRSRYNKKIAGVCAGVADYFDADPTLVRILWIALAIAPFPGAILAYIIAWIAMPQEPVRLVPGPSFVPAQPYSV